MDKKQDEKLYTSHIKAIKQKNLKSVDQKKLKLALY